MDNIFTVPDKEKNYQGYMVFVLTIIWSTVTGLIVSMGLYFFPEIWSRWLTFLCVSIFIAVFNLSLNRLGYVQLASWSLSIMLWLYVTIPCYSAGGVFAPGILSQMSVILTAGFLLGWRGGLAFGILTMGTDFWFAYLELTGGLPKPTVVHNPLTRWISAIIPFGTLLALQYYATNHLRSSLVALQNEVTRREKAEKLKDKTLYDLAERVKELKTLYAVSRILQNENAAQKELFREIVELIPLGWQYPEIAAACITIEEVQYASRNYKPSQYYQQAETRTAKGTLVRIDVVYSKKMSEVDNDLFLDEERNLINVLVEMLKNELERKERSAELKDYKYALDSGYIVSVSALDGTFTYLNENFCKVSKYSREELLGKNHSILWSGVHPPEYFDALQIAMQDGKPYNKEFCNRAKDGSFYWVDTTIVPFLDESGKVYQYLSINHEITDRKIADEKIKESEKLLRKITSQMPGNTYMFEIGENGEIDILFMSHGSENYKEIYETTDSTPPTILNAEYYENDKDKLTDAVKDAKINQSALSVQYRIVVNGHIRWRWMQAVPEKESNGNIVWYGATSDITSLVDYIASIEQIIFDIGHVIRRPISNIIGMTRIISTEDLNENEIKEISIKLRLIAEEMDRFIRELNVAYQQKRKTTQHNIDVSSLLDKRDSLFQ